MIVECPQCRRKLTARDELSGKKAKCPSCNHAFILPLAPIRSHAAASAISALAPDAPDGSNEELYARMCAEAAFTEQKEDRTFRSDPAFDGVLSLLNVPNYPAAIVAAEQVMPRYQDFDLPYHWLADACMNTGQLERSHQVLMEGLARTRRKSLMLTTLGDTDWRLGKICEAVYWWCQAVHCLSANPTGEATPYLFLSYVAEGCGLGDAQQRLLGQADKIRAGKVRLVPTDAGALIALVRSRSLVIGRVVQDIVAKHLPDSTLASARSQIATSTAHVAAGSVKVYYQRMVGRKSVAVTDRSVTVGKQSIPLEEITRWDQVAFSGLDIAIVIICTVLTWGFALLLFMPMFFIFRSKHVRIYTPTRVYRYRLSGRARGPFVAALQASLAERNRLHPAPRQAGTTPSISDRLVAPSRSSDMPKKAAGGNVPAVPTASRKKVVLIAVAGVVGILGLLVWIGSKESVSWDYAQKENSIAAYETYLKTHPEGSHASGAKTRLEQLRTERENAWAQIKAAAVPADVEGLLCTYFDRFPNGNHIASFFRRNRQDYLEGLRSSDPVRRANNAGLLAEHGGGNAVLFAPYLIHLLKDDTELQILSGPRGGPKFMFSKTGRTTTVGDQALFALKRITDNDFGKDANKWQEWWADWWAKNRDQFH